MKNDDGFLIFLNKYLILNPNPITPTSPSEYDVSIHRDIIAARSYAMTMSMWTTKRQRQVAPFSLFLIEEKNMWVPINPKPCKILLYRPTCDRMDLQRPKSNNKQRARIIVLLLVCARRSTAINSREHAVVSHTHSRRVQTTRRVSITKKESQWARIYFKPRCFSSSVVCG